MVPLLLSPFGALLLMTPSLSLEPRPCTRFSGEHNPHLQKEHFDAASISAILTLSHETTEAYINNTRGSNMASHYKMSLPGEIRLEVKDHMASNQ